MSSIVSRESYIETFQPLKLNGRRVTKGGDEYSVAYILVNSGIGQREELVKTCGVLQVARVRMTVHVFDLGCPIIPYWR